MLILTRKCSEVIQIGDDILIKVIRTGRSTVKLGIDAPDNVRVLRGELADHGIPARKGDILELTAIDKPEATCLCSDQFPHPLIA